MAVLIDTDIFVAARNARDINHERAVILLRKALLGEFGEIYTSILVLYEAIATAWAITKDPRIALDIGKFILSSNRLKLLFVDDEVLREAWLLYEKYIGRGITFVDATSIALMKRYRIDYIMSFNPVFDDIVNRIS